MQEEKKYPCYVFIIFVIVYSISASIWQIPYSSTLRWIVMGLLVIAGIVYGHGRITVFSKEYYCIVAMLVTGILVSIFRPNFVTGIERTCSFFLLIIGIYAYFDGGHKEDNRIEIGIMTFARILEVLAFVLGIYYIFSGQSYGEYRAIYANKNYAAPIFSVATSYCMLLYYTESRAVMKMIHLVATILSVFLVSATGSRAGLLSIAGIIFILPFLFETVNSPGILLKRFAIILLLLASAYLIVRFANIPALGRLLSEEDEYSSTGFSRGDMWRNGIYLFSLRPIFGWGSSAAYHYTFINNSSGYGGWGVHSSYIMLLIDHGVVGVTLFVAFILLMSKRFIYEIKSIGEYFGQREKRIVLLLVTACVALLIDAVAESFLFATGSLASVCFWISLAFIDMYLNHLNTMKGQRCEY